MILPGLPSLLLLAYCLLLLPLAAIRSARLIRKVRAASGQLPISRQAIWIQTLLSQAVLFLLAWFAASSFGFELFWRPPTGPRDIAAAAVALIACLFIRAWNHCRIANTRMTQECCFEFGGSNLEAFVLNQLLRTVDNKEVTVFVCVTDVASVQPTFRIDRNCGCLRSIQVTFHYLRTTNTNLTFFIWTNSLTSFEVH